jgi:hypothetical protein
MNRAFHTLPADFVDDDATIEMELTPAQLEMLTRAAQAEPQVARPTAVRNVVELAPPLIPVRAQPTVAPRADERAPNAAAARPGVPRIAIGVGIVAVFAVSASVAYLTAPPPAATISPPAEIVPEPARPAEPVLPDTESPQVVPPVLFANPFDATEIFEFPPGTTPTEARDAVADVLLKRARERLNLSGTNPGPSAAPDTGAPRPRLARRD